MNTRPTVDAIVKGLASQIHGDTDLDNGSLFVHFSSTKATSEANPSVYVEADFEHEDGTEWLLSFQLTITDFEVGRP